MIRFESPGSAMNASKDDPIPHPPGAPGAPTPADIQAELARILQGPSFRTSKRSQQFLTFVVNGVLSGAPDNLKERAIGIAVFARPPAYDTGEDATVRVAAGEVRKRLAQYYIEARPPVVRIDLPPGSYIPEFHLVAPPSLEQAAPPEPLPVHPSPLPSPPPRRWLRAAAPLLLLAAAAVFFLPVSRPSLADQFWRPVLDSSRPVFLCLTQPVVFLISDRIRDEYAAKHNINQLAGPFVPQIDPKDLRPGDLFPSSDQYVGAGDAEAVSLFTSLFSRKNKPIQLRIGQDISFADLRAAPSILIGAYSNRWTMMANLDHRFSFQRRSVVDRTAPSRVWKIDQVSLDYKSTEDYSIVSRIFQSYTGQLTVTAAGITNAGTRAAAEFLTNPTYLNAALAKAPDGWQKRNMQLVLHCKVIGSTPGPPEVVATHFW